MKKTIVCIIALTMVFMVGGFAQAEVSRDGLIAEYLFNANADDTSGNENHGTLYGPTLTEDRFGNSNSAYSFDGNNDNIVVQNSDTLDVTSAITIEAWVNIAGHHGGQHYVVDSRDGLGGGYGLNVDTDTIQFWIGNRWPTFNFGIEPGEWHHVVGTYDGTSMIMYIDGAMEANIPFTASFAPSTGPLYIGTFWQGPGQFFRGIIDEVAIWNRVLTPEEVLERYETVWPPPALVGYWKFDEDSDDTAYDSSAYGNNGEIEGASPATGKCGGALYFDAGADGSVDYVKVPYSDSINTSTFTVSFWVSISDLDKSMVFLHKRNGQWWRNFEISYNTVRPNGEPKHYLRVKIDNGTSSNDYDNAAYAEVSLENGRYYYVVGTYDQEKLKLYLDGIKIAEHSITMTNNVGGGDLYIGTHSADHLAMNPTHGIIDEVRIYNYALTQVQIQADMGACFPETYTVPIDIKPESCPNPLNTKSQGVLPVAILGAADFDVTSIDVASIRVGEVDPVRSIVEDVATPVVDPQNGCDCNELGGDGINDLTLKFNTQDIVDALGQVDDREVVELTVTGVLIDGTPFEGKDCIVIRAKGGKGKIEEPDQCYAGVPQTGQSTPYATGDDGDLQRGVVCPESPEPRFTDNGDGTVTDNCTGLMWTKSAQQIPGPMTWNDALTACNDLVFAGHKDWSVPNVNEFYSIVHYSASCPALPISHPFTDEVCDKYWTSTTVPPSPPFPSADDTALAVYMNFGQVWANYKTNTGFKVWCVRSGN